MTITTDAELFQCLDDIVAYTSDTEGDRLRATLVAALAAMDGHTVVVQAGDSNQTSYGLFDRLSKFFFGATQDFSERALHPYGGTVYFRADGKPLVSLETGAPLTYDHVFNPVFSVDDTVGLADLPSITGSSSTVYLECTTGSSYFTDGNYYSYNGEDQVIGGRPEGDLNWVDVQADTARFFTLDVIAN